MHQGLNLAMNILLSAFAFEPSESSEPGVAWRFAQIASQEHNVWILTADFPSMVARTRAFFAVHPHPRLHVVPFWPRGIARTNRGERVNLQYWLWQRQVIRQANHLHAMHQFSVVHQITLSRYWTPTSLCLLPVPFVWGPVGSAESTPLTFLRTLPTRNKLQTIFRDFARMVSERDPLLRLCARTAKATFATTTEALAKVRQLGARDPQLMPQVFLSDDRLRYFAALPAPHKLAPLRILSIGRQLYWNGFQYGLEAVSLLKQKGVPFIYTIVGEGPYNSVLKSLASQLGIENDIIFIPRVQGDIGHALQDCHVLLHPALHESFGNVCLEALAAGRPVICLNVGGPASQVTPECGFAAPILCPKGAVMSIANQLAKLATQPGKWQQMSEAAKTRAQSGFALEKLRENILHTYRRVQSAT